MRQWHNQDVELLKRSNAARLHGRQLRKRVKDQREVERSDRHSMHRLGQQQVIGSHSSGLGQSHLGVCAEQTCAQNRRQVI